MGVLFEGLSTDECDDFRVICLIAGLKWSDFQVRVDCEQKGERTGRKLVDVLYKPSDRHRTYRAGTGNLWMPAFEKEIETHCFDRKKLTISAH